MPVLSFFANDLRFAPYTRATVANEVPLAVLVDIRITAVRVAEEGNMAYPLCVAFIGIHVLPLKMSPKICIG